jgi:hypothetical protein
VKYERLLIDVKARLLGDLSCYCTTFFDFYGLPASFPGKNAMPEAASIEDKAQAVQQALVDRLTQDLSEDVLRRFIPFVQMYEFEALLFSDTTAFAAGIDRPDKAAELADIVNAFETPEHINNSQQTAPSKRILKLLPNYEKPILGSLAAMEIGIETIKQECKLFNAWLLQIEQLSP